MTKMLRILCLSFMFCGIFGARDARAEGIPFVALNHFQIVSLHYGFATDLNNAYLDSTNHDKFSGIIGVSVGWNKFADIHLHGTPCIDIPFIYSCVGFGLRAKYLYMDTYAPTHFVGGLVYIYPEESILYDYTFGAIILGLGANFSKIGTSQANGWYAEVGVGLFKIFPILLNTDIIYRVNFYNNPNELHLGTIHSFNFVWTFL